MRGRSLIVPVVLALVPVAALGQSNAEINAGVQFNFRPPGARSLGLGGAFIALADDATAAYSNPAGLGVLTKPEVSLEIRNATFTSRYTDHGNASATSGIGIDTVAGIVDAETDEGSSGPSFLSVVFPRGRLAVAVYRQELARFRASATTQGAYVDSNYRAFPAQSTMDLDIVNYGLSTSFRLSDAFWLGAGISLYDFDLNSVTDRFDVNRRDAVFNDTRIGGFYGPPDYSQINRVNSQTQQGEDRGVAVTVGMIWRPSSKVQVAGVFRGGPDFQGVVVTNEPGPRTTFSPKTSESGFKVPDSFGLGVAWRPTDRFLVAGDVVRVRYSQRLNYFVDAFGGFGQADPEDFQVDDGTELHFGAEYVLASMKTPLAFRAGIWTDPDSRIRWVGPAIQDTATILFREGETTVHTALGFGWVVGRRFQLDGAADLSSRVNTLSLSAVMRF